MVSNDEYYIEQGILTLTNKCNNRCIICQDSETMRKGCDLDFNQAQNLILEIKKKNKDITIYGAEPFLYKDIEKILDFAYKQELKINLSTNGRIFQYDIFCELARKYKLNLAMTLFSINEQEHDKITNVIGSCRQLKNGIKKLKNYKINFVVRIVVTKINIDSVVETLEFLYDNNTRIVISGLINQGRILDHPELICSFDEIKKLINKLENKYRKKILIEKIPRCAFKKEELFEFMDEKCHNNYLYVPSSQECKKCTINCHMRVKQNTLK